MYTSPQPGQVKTSFKTISIIYFGLLMGQLLFAVVSFLIAPEPSFKLDNTSDPLLFAVPLMAVFCVVVGNMLYRKQLALAANMNSVKSKLAAYQTALIISAALIEGASLFGIVTFIISGNLVFITISGLLMLYFIYRRPTKENIADDLNLTYEDRIGL